MQFPALSALSSGLAHQQDVAAGDAPLALMRYVGQVKLPADDEYRFHFQARPAGFVVVDGQTVIELGLAEAQVFARWTE